MISPRAWGEAARPERIFLWLFLPAACAFCLLTPPFQAPDEPAHLYRAFQVSELRILPASDTTRLGGEIPVQLHRMATELRGAKRNHKADLQLVRSYLRGRLDSENRQFVEFLSALYSPVPYVPQAVGVGLGRILHLPPLALLYLGRLANLACAAGLIYWSLRWIPSYRWSLTLIALTPMFLFLAGSLSADATTLALMFLWVAQIVRLASRPPGVLEVQDKLRIAAISVLLSLSKQVHFIALLALLAVPARRCGGHKRYWSFVGGIAILNGLVLGAWTVLVGGNVDSTGLGRGTAPQQQLAAALSDPLSYVAALLTTLERYWSFYAVSFVGNFGWLDTPLPAWMAWLYLVLLLLVALGDAPEGRGPDLRLRLTSAVVVVSFTLAVMTFFFLYWSPLGVGVVFGVQGRYFLPVAPFVVLTIAMHGRRFREVGLWARPAAAAYLVPLIAVSLILVWMRYYVT